MLQSFNCIKKFGIAAHVYLKQSRSLSCKFSTSLTRFKDIQELNFKIDEYSEPQKSEILRTINGNSEEELKKYDISKLRLKNLILQKQTRGGFASVKELMELEGFGVKTIEKFCNSILAEQSNDPIKGLSKTEKNQEKNDELQNTKISRKGQMFLSPQLPETIRKSMTSCVSFNIDFNFIAWTKFSLNQENVLSNSSIVVEEWTVHEINRRDEKLTLYNQIQLLMHLNKTIPPADVYVLEAQQSPSIPKQGSSSPVQTSVNIARAQLFSMLSLMMAMRYSSLNNSSKELLDANSIRPPIFFLKNYLASRLYRIIIGNERIAAKEVVEKIFYHSDTTNPRANPSLSSIEIPLNLKEIYLESSNIEREFMGQSMLIGLAFLKLCVLKCKDSIVLSQTNTYDDRTGRD